MTAETERFVYDGRECKIVFQPHGHWCGYAKTPLKFGYDDVYGFNNLNTYQLIDAHGGLTYGVDPDGWIGFDCGHAGDVNLSPDGERNELMGWSEDSKVWDSESVREEVEKLADQLTLLEQFVEVVSR